MTHPARLLAAALLMLGSAGAASAQSPSADTYGGRPMLVYAPAKLPPTGSRALVIVLHGGGGNANRIAGGQAESGLNMDAVAERDGFVVAYLNGTQVARMMAPNMLGWNAGSCCGLPAQNKTDDAAYIKGAVDYLVGKYGIDRRRVFGMGHSNGSMMSLRLLCETDLYAAVVAISGPLGLDVARCPAAQGKRILALHGADDQNVPVGGGRGKGLSNTDFSSEEHSRQVFTNSGAQVTVQIIPGAEHKLDTIDAAIRKAEGVSIAEKAARFFGLSGAGA